MAVSFVALLLVLVGVGVLLIVRSSIIWGGFQALLEEGDYQLVVRDGYDIVQILLKVRKYLVSGGLHGCAVRDSAYRRECHNLSLFE